MAMVLHSKLVGHALAAPLPIDSKLRTAVHISRISATGLPGSGSRHAAVSFYRDKMGYVVDESSAFNFNQNDVWELVKYNPASRGSPQAQAARSFGEQHKGAGYAACQSQGHGQLPRRQSPLDDAAKPSRKRNKAR